MRKLLLTLIGWSAFTVLVTGLVAFNMLLVWVATGPRDLRQFLPYIETALSDPERGNRVQIAQGMLLWDGWQHPLDIRLKELDVIAADGTRFANFPDVSVGLDLFSLLRAKVVPTSLTVRKPVISLLKTESGISFGPPNGEGPPQEGPRISGFTSQAIMEAFSHAPLNRLRSLSIVGASVTVGSMQEGVLLEARNVSFTVTRKRRTLKIEVNGAIVQEQGEAQAHGDIGVTLRGYQELQGRLEWSNLQPDTFLRLAPKNENTPRMDMPVSGWVSVHNSSKQPAPVLNFGLRGEAGNIATPALEEPLAIAGFSVEGKAVLSDAQQDVEISVLNIALPGEGKDAPGIQGEGLVSMRQGDAAVKAALSAKNIPVKDIRRFWPVELSRESRKWVVTNVTEGTVEEAKLNLNVDYGQFALPTLPDAAVAAKIHFRNGTVSFLPEHPPLKDVTGNVLISGERLSVEAEQGRAFENTQVSKLNVRINDLNADNPRIEVGFDIATTAKDAADFLSRPPVDVGKRLKITPANVSGAAKGHVDLGFYFEAPRDENGKIRDDMGVDYSIKADVENATIPGLLGRFDIAEATGVLVVDNAGLSYNGTGRVNGVAARSEVKYLFTPQEGVDTFITAAARGDAASLPRFGYPELPFVKGPFDLVLDIKLGPRTENVGVKADMKDAQLEWKDMNWKKPPGQPATLSFTARGEQGGTSLDDFALSSGDERINGSLKVGGKDAGLQSANLTRLKLGSTDLSRVRYEAIPQGFRLRAAGKAADLRGFLQGDGEFTFTGFPAMDVEAEVGEVRASDALPLEDVKAQILCTPARCEYASLTAQAGGKPLTARLDKREGIINVDAQNAGAALLAAGFYDNMHGGTLKLTGNYGEDGTLKGVLNVEGFTVTGAPVLARLISLASITGIPSLLSGDGIKFNKLHVPFEQKDDIIRMSDAKAYGSSIGLSAEGTASFPGQVLQLKGTLAPAYALNSGFLSKIPLIGDALTGGGDGIIAARYTLTGKASEPDVSVNPLSVLTPGFLRGIFDVFDSPEPKQPAVDYSPLPPAGEG